MSEEKYSRCCFAISQKLNGQFIYLATKVIGVNAIEEIIENYIKIVQSKSRITPEIVNRYFDEINQEFQNSSKEPFSKEGTIRHPDEMLYELKGITDKLRIKEISRLMRLEFGRKAKRWDDVFKVMPSLEAFISVLDSNYSDLKLSGVNTWHYDEEVKNLIYRKIFTATSEVIDLNSSWGFCFSPTLFLAKPRIFYTEFVARRDRKWCRQRGTQRGVRGKPKTRNVIFHMCPKKPFNKALIKRPVNNNKPTFFCRTCKERLVPGMKACFKLTELGKKIK